MIEPWLSGAGEVALVLASALLLDKALGEPRRFHPLVGLGKLISLVEAKGYRDTRLAGLLAVMMLSVPVVLLWGWSLPWWMDALLLYLVIGGRSLGEHGQAVADALHQQNLVLARERVGYIVSRKTEQLSEQQVVSATVESMLENGNDAVFGALFWYLVGGLPAAILYRIANTLDARWGYRNARWNRFGWAAARWDDLLNYLPARLTVLTYAVQGAWQGRAASAWRCARDQGRRCASPNGGPVMAAGAGALGVTIGGPAQYDGYLCDKPWLGVGPAARAEAIEGAIELVNRGAWLWVGLVAVVTLLAGAGA